MGMRREQMMIMFVEDLYQASFFVKTKTYTMVYKLVFSKSKYILLTICVGIKMKDDAR